MSVFGGRNIINDNCLLYLDAGNPVSHTTESYYWYDLSPRQEVFVPGNDPTYANDTTSSGSMFFVQSAESGRWCMTGSEFTRCWISQNDSPFVGQLNFAYTMFAVVREQKRNTYSGILTVNKADSSDCFALTSYNGRLFDDHWQPCGLRDDTATLGINECAMVTFTCTDWRVHRSPAYSAHYKNGIQVAASAYNSANATAVESLNGGNWKIGNWQENRQDMDWLGEIEMVLMYDYAMNAQEVWETFASLRGKYGL